MLDPMTRTPVHERTVAAVLDKSVSASPTKVAVREVDGNSLTYEEVQTSAFRFANFLSELGVKRQESVLVLLDNHIDMVLVWAGLGVGAMVEVPVNTAYKGDMLQYIMEHSGAEVLIVEDRWCDRIAAVADRVPKLHTVVVRGGDGSALPDQLRRVAFESFSGSGDERPDPPNVWDVTAIMYTSGTTGASKGVLCPHGHAFAGSVAYPIAEKDDVVLLTLPLFHIGGLWGAVYNAFIAGATVVVAHGFSASDFWGIVRRYECTSTLLLGVMADFLYRRPARDDDSSNPLRAVGVIPVPGHIDDFCERFGVTAEGGYGLTEAGTMMVTGPGSARPSSCGTPRSFLEVKIVDEHDVEVAPGEVGELVVRSREPWAMMLGYHNMPDETQRVWRNLWLHTGDAHMYRDGVYMFMDRKKDAVRRRGENISSVEVEQQIMVCEEVAEVAVVAVASEYTEDELKAFISLKPGSTLSPRALFLDLAERMPYFMVPRYYEFVASLPKTPTFKIKKAELRALGLTPDTWDAWAAGLEVTRDGVVETERVAQ